MRETLRLFSVRSAPWIVAVLLFASCVPVARSQEVVVRLVPANTTINFTLGATMHTVHGTFKLKSGEIRVDPATGKARGSIVVDATSGDSDNSSRDHKMHKEILESDKYPEIVFSPAQLTPQPGHTLRETLTQKGTTQVAAAGIFRLHGEDHNVMLDLEVKDDGNGHLEISSSFPVPYIKWGLKSPDTFILRVSDTVDLELHAAGEISAQQ